MHSERDTHLDAIRARIISDRLPHAEEYEILDSPGDGTPCACCDKPIISAQTLYKVELSDGRAFSMHLYCYDNWRQESLSIQQA
jgi:hypothetical protein